MKTNIRKRPAKLIRIWLGTAAVICVAVIAQAQTTQITLTGEINDTYQLVAGGKVYNIAETPAGDDLVTNFISQKVKVTGTLQPGEEIDVITVLEFQLVAE